MTYCVYTNAQRQGTVLNMTIKEAREFTRGFHTFYTISVWDHKTTAAYGSAKIVIPKWVYTTLLKYIEKHREGCKNEDLIFINTKGEKVTKLAGELETPDLEKRCTV